MSDSNIAPKEELQKRLRRIEGQVRGVARMVDEDRDCREIVQQLAAIRAATHQVGLLVARSYACQCMSEPADQAMLDDLISIMGKATQEG
jgi:DNA-binding FrmR family transcriptional regulator